MDFLGAVNRIFRQEGVIEEDAEIASFASNAFRYSTEIAKLAVQNEINSLTAEEYIPYEAADAEITLLNGTRLYSLASDFTRFRDRSPYMVEVDSSSGAKNRLIFDYPGGEEALRKEILDYREQTGDPSWFYFVRGTTKQVGFYTVPDASAHGKIYRYYYEKSVNVTSETDVVPFVSEGEAQAFVDLAATRFRYMRATEAEKQGLYPQGLSSIPDRSKAMGVLISMMNPKGSSGNYGRRYYLADPYL